MRAAPWSWQAGPQRDGHASHLPGAGHRQVPCVLALAGDWMHWKTPTSAGATVILDS